MIWFIGNEVSRLIECPHLGIADSDHLYTASFRSIGKPLTR